MPEAESACSVAAIALGSNLAMPGGTRADHLRRATERIREFGYIRAVSTFHDTAPEIYLQQPRFLNAALLLETKLAPLDLLHVLLGIEHTLGRRRDRVPPKGPRVLDLDLIYVDDLVLNTPELTLPHPAMQDRSFVLAPLAEIAPDWRHPVLDRTTRQLLQALRPDRTSPDRISLDQTP